MALTGQTMSAFDNVLKIFYLPTVREQLNNKTVLMKRLKRNTKDVSGKYALLALHKGRNLGIGARADAATLPTAGKQSYSNATVYTKFNYGRIEVSGPTIEASRNDKGAFLKVVDSELKGVTNDLKKDINRQLFSDGTGIICKNNDTTEATPVVVAKRFWKHPEYYLTDNFSFNIISSGLDTLRDTATAATVNGTATSTSVPFDGGATFVSTVTTDFVVKANAHIDGGVATGTMKEMMGLRGLIDDGNIMENTATTALALHPQGIDANANSYWRAKVLENPSSAGTARALTLDLMQEAFDNVEIKEGGNVSLIITTAGIRRKYLDLLRADRRFIKEMKLDGGFSAVEYNGVPLVVDIDCTNYDMYFLDESTLQIYMMSDFDWMDEDGAVLSRVSNYDAYEAVLYWYANLGIDNRSKNCRLADISETEL